MCAEKNALEVDGIPDIPYIISYYVLYVFRI